MSFPRHQTALQAKPSVGWMKHFVPITSVEPQPEVKAVSLGKNGRRSTVVMVDWDTHARLRRHAMETGRKIEWLATHLIERGLQNAGLN